MLFLQKQKSIENSNNNPEPRTNIQVLFDYVDDDKEGLISGISFLKENNNNDG